MWAKIAFRLFGNEKKVEYLKTQGIMLGTRTRSNRKVFLYMLKDFFVEVTYTHDDIDLQPERMETFSNLSNLNSYLERDLRAAF